jgi:hypothetical protein
MSPWPVVVVVCGGWWSSGNEAEVPIVSVPIASDGAMFAPWASEDGTGTWSAREGQLAPDCEWWNGTYYYDPSLCSHMSVTRMPAAYAQQAIERATRCAAHGDTDCVLSGEIGFNLPAAFVYDESQGMRMVVAPKMLAAEGAELRTVRLQDPEGEHPNQLFKFEHVVRVEYLKAASRTMETLELRGNEAYCMQALRRSVVPTCWAALD